jgi:hypothetical protein
VSVLHIYNPKIAAKWADRSGRHSDQAIWRGISARVILSSRPRDFAGKSVALARVRRGSGACASRRRLSSGEGGIRASRKTARHAPSGADDAVESSKRMAKREPSGCGVGSSISSPPRRSENPRASAPHHKTHSADLDYIGFEPS